MSLKYVNFTQLGKMRLHHGSFHRDALHKRLQVKFMEISRNTLLRVILPRFRIGSKQEAKKIKLIGRSLGKTTSCKITM